MQLSLMKFLAALPQLTNFWFARRPRAKMRFSFLSRWFFREPRERTLFTVVKPEALDLYVQEHLINGLRNLMRSKDGKGASSNLAIMITTSSVSIAAEASRPLKAHRLDNSVVLSPEMTLSFWMTLVLVTSTRPALGKTFYIREEAKKRKLDCYGLQLHLI